MISTIANDGVWTPARIVAATLQPQSTPQMIAFHPALERRVLSPLAAAEMKQMMQGVVLHGTGRKAILEGYSSAGKTGTAQKIDPATHTYSRTKYIASFAGFAPVNNPVVTVAVILDSPLGGHHGGEVGAPVFNRIAQQVLEYLHTPHDVELPRNRQLLLAARRVKDQDLEEGSPDHLGDALDMADAAAPDAQPAYPVVPQRPTSESAATGVVPAALHEPERVTPPAQARPVTMAPPSPGAPAHLPSSGTVILDVEQGGIVVPSFMGKTVRAAVELAQENGLDLEAVGSGVAREQSPAPGSHVPSGSRVTVKFGR
jgi:cell division protein FtsI (penicillin-binding protein 3)